MTSIDSIQTLPQALSYLNGRLNFESSPGRKFPRTEWQLERMCQLCQILRHPERRVPAIHIAGTKGKGSTAHMLASILQTAGYRIGLYTSPHLISPLERIVVNGQPIASQDFVARTREVAAAATALEAARSHDRPTYFELMTAMAFQQFAQSSVDFAVVEVGMGGRLDSTNVCQPVCSVITNVSLDHVQHLGRTLAAIAREKAGIIKPSVPLISGVQAPSARRAVEQTAVQLHVPYRVLGRDFHFLSKQDPIPVSVLSGSHETARDADRNGWTMEYQSPGGIHVSDLEIGLLGRHQHTNAALALAVCEELEQRGVVLEESSIREGLRRAYVPARMEIVGYEPITLLDTAHNQASIAATVQGMTDYWPDRRRLLILAVTRGKNVRGMIRYLLPHIDHLILTQYQDNPRAEPVEAVRRIAEEVLCQTRHLRDCRLESVPLPAKAWERARSLAGPGDLICVTGSFFLAAELAPRLAAVSSSN